MSRVKGDEKENRRREREGKILLLCPTDLSSWCFLIKSRREGTVSFKYGVMAESCRTVLLSSGILPLKKMNPIEEDTQVLFIFSPPLFIESYWGDTDKMKIIQVSDAQFHNTYVHCIVCSLP